MICLWAKINARQHGKWFEGHLFLLIVSDSSGLNISPRSSVLLQKHPVPSCQLGSLKHPLVRVALERYRSLSWEANNVWIIAHTTQGVCSNQIRAKNTLTFTWPNLRWGYLLKLKFNPCVVNETFTESKASTDCLLQSKLLFCCVNYTCPEVEMDE